MSNWVFWFAVGIFMVVLLVSGVANWSDHQAELDEKINIRDQLQRQYSSEQAETIVEYTKRSHKQKGAGNEHNTAH